MAGYRGVTEAAHRLNLSPQRVRDLADSGTLPHERTANGVRLFTDENIERLRKKRSLAQRLKRKSRGSGEAA